MPNLTRVGQNRIYAPYMTVYMVVSLPKIPYIHRIFMVLANSEPYSSGAGFCATAVQVPQFRCRSSSGATAVQVPQQFRCRSLGAAVQVPQQFRCRSSSGATAIQVPQFRCHSSSGATAVQVPQQFRCHSSSGAAVQVPQQFRCRSSGAAAWSAWPAAR